MDEQQTFQNNPPYGQGFTPTAQQNLPNATAVLILGILSIVFICPYISLVSIVLGIIAIVLASKDQQLYNANKSLYSYSSYNNLKAGKVCAIIGLSVAAFTFLMLILFIIGIFAALPFWGMVD
ncbi:MAG: CCC motif membrane protein [Bacteroidetes bacterium]|nr:CCC motif membrane protein [Bacteroidota bacterium]